MIYVSDIIDKCGGKLICGDLSLPIENISKDTRTIQEGDIYIGIKGTNFDGNLFYQDAFNKGATICILDNIDESSISDKYLSKTIVKVDDTVKCLQELAAYKREINDIPVIAVTGSVGKTSTKEMIASVLSKKYKVLKSEGNNNNQIGLPLNILRLKDEDIMVLEMGMSSFGEISNLTRIAKPTIGVITNIGTSHIGDLGSRENIMKAKLEIIEGLNGPLIINNDNDMLHNNIEMIKELNKVITVGINNKSDYMAMEIDGNNFIVDGDKMESPINNMAFIYNSLISYVVGKLCDVDVEKIREGILDVQLVSGRLEYKKLENGAVIIDGTYNASLDAIKSSLEILRKEKATRRGAIIGDVLDLGEYTRDIHREIGRALLESDLDFIVTIGSNTNYTDEYLKENKYDNWKHFAKEEDSYEYIQKLLKSGDVVLIKGSHAMHLDNIVKWLVRW